MNVRSFKNFIIVFMIALAAVFACAFMNAAPAYAAEENYSPDQVFSVSAKKTTNQAIYGSGVPTSDSVAVTMSFVSSAPNSQVRFQYAEVSSSSGAYAEIPEQAWAAFAESGGDTTNGKSVVRVFPTVIGTESIKYMYFRSVLTTADSGAGLVTRYYSDKQIFCVHIVPAPTVDSLSIVTKARASATDPFVPYDGTTWIAKEIEFTVSVPKYINCYYRTVPSGGSLGGWIPLAPDVNDTAVRKLSLSKDNFARGLNGAIEFAYDNPDTGERVTDGEYVKTVKFDPVSPEYQVSATYQKDGRTEIYQSGMTCASAVTYELRPNVDGQNLSGFSFYYYTAATPPINKADATEIKISNGKYTVNITSTTKTLHFMAYSGAGLRHLQNEKNYETVIDDKTPVAKISATDSRGIALNYTGGNAVWASQSIAFVLENLTANVSAKYEYRVEGSDQFIEMPISNGQNVLTVGFPLDYKKSTLTNQRIYFRITSAAGLSSGELTFVYSLAKNDFKFGFSMDSFQPDLWVNHPLNLAFTTDTMDYTFGYRVQNTDANKPLVPLVGEWVLLAESGLFEFRTALSGSINGFAVSFYAINFAGVECKSAVSTATTLKMDTMQTQLTPKGSLYGAVAGSYFEEGAWVNGNVTLTFFSAGANISGFRIIKLIKNGNDFVEDDGELQKNADGNYVDSLAYTGDYYYIVKTGAGLERRISYRVNIDDAPIVLNYYEVRIGQEGDWLSETKAVEYLAKYDISDNLYLRFFSNHTATVGGVATNHFLFYTSVDGVAYTKGDISGMYCYDLSAIKDAGSVRLSFYLQSTAVNNAGAASDTKSNLREISFRYNRIGAKLEVSLVNGSPINWNYTEVKFSLKNMKDVGIGEYRYQYSVNNVTSWVTIPSADLQWNASTGMGGFNFGGGVGVHVNGIIFFRVLNAAGYSSEEPVRIEIKIDTTKPDALRSADFGTVQYTKDELGKILYYAGSLRLRTPSDTSYAPTSFYYSTSGATRPESHGTPVANSGWTLLDGVSGYAISSTQSISFYATNLHNSDYQVWTVNIDSSAGMKIKVECSLMDGDMIGTLFRFKWAETNRVTLTATGSMTDVKYYWSVLGSGVWTELHDQSAEPLEWHATDKPFGYRFNTAMSANVVFRAVNKGGKTVESGQTVVLQIDTAEVTYNVAASVDGKPYDAQNSPQNGWSNYDILFTIEQTSVNPSGVAYQYALGEYDNTVAPTGNWNALVDFTLTSLLLDKKNNGNLQGRLWIRAAKRSAPNKWTQQNIIFRVDKLDPNFDMEAAYTDKTDSQVTVKSGQWFNSKKADGTASAVEIKLTKREETPDAITGRVWKNASKVTYSYIIGGKVGALAETFSYIYQGESREKITFLAVSEAGKEVKKEFILNIDNIAPEFVNGNSNQYSITNGVNGQLNTYFVDQKIRWEKESEESLESATVNGLILINGGTVSTYQTYLGTPGTEDYGKVTIIVKDKAGNSSVLKFILQPFPLTVETISLSVEDSKLLSDLNAAVIDASGGDYGALKDNSRRAYFTNLIDRLYERQEMLKTEITVFQEYLKGVYVKESFTLEHDYTTMTKQIALYGSFAAWQKDLIRTGAFEPTLGAPAVTYQKAYDTMIERYNALDLKMREVLKVQEQVTMLPAVKSVVKSDYPNVRKALSAYKTLSSDQKSCFETTLVSKLDSLLHRCEVLLLQNETLGVSIDGEGLTGGAELSAVEVSSKTEDYANTQRKILSGYASDVPRALISLIKLSLTDFGSNTSTTPTGRIRITLAIPEKYQNNIYFTVYSIVGDTVTRIDNVLIDPNGASVTFETSSLGTYALATLANVVDKGNGGKVYGTIFGVTIDGQMIVFILIGVGGLVLLLILVVILTAMRRQKFLKRYDRRYKQGLAARGVEKVPRGNKARRTNPLHPNEYIVETKLTEPTEKKKKHKKAKKDDIDLDI